MLVTWNLLTKYLQFIVNVGASQEKLLVAKNYSLVLLTGPYRL